MELGGPEVGRGCGGRGIIHGFELLEKLGFHEWGFDYVLLDFLGDVVCGGFGLPIARDMCQKVIVVGSNDLQSLYVANNVCSAVEYFRKLGGNVGVGGPGHQQGRRHRRGAGLRRGGRHSRAGRDSGRRGHPPQERQLRDHRPARQRAGRSLFEELAANVAEAPPLRPEAADPGRAARPVQGRRGRPRRRAGAGDASRTCAAARCVEKPTLEVVYDTV